MALCDVNGVLDRSRTVLTIVLCDLIPSGLVLVEVMFSVKSADRLNLTVQSNCGAQGWEECGSLEFLHLMSARPSRLSSHTNRLATRKGEVEQGNIRIGGLARGGRSPYSNLVSRAPECPMCGDRATYGKTALQQYPAAHGSPHPQSIPILV